MLLCMLLGGVTAVDAVSWPQAMISRPVVSATLGGAVLGEPLAGLTVGAILELLALRHLPMGTASYPDTGPAGVVAGASAAVSVGPAGLAAATLAGWAIGWMGSRTVGWLRSLNAWLVAGPSVQELAARPARLERRHRWAVALDVARGGVLVGALLVPAAALSTIMPDVRGAPAEVAVVGGLIGALAAGAGAGGGALSSRGREVLLVALGAVGMIVLRTLV